MTSSTSAEDERNRAVITPAHRDHPALVDPVSELPSRLHFDVVYRVVFAAGTRGFPITVLLLEAPGLAGDEDLRELARRLASLTRRMDLLARFDETRIVALLLSCNIHDGRVAAERMVVAMEPWLASRNAEMKVGAAAIEPGMEAEGELLDEARKALADALALPGCAIETRP